MLQGSHDGFGALLKNHCRQVIIDNKVNCPVKDAESFYLEVEQHFKNSKFFFIPVTKIQDITEKMKISERFQLAKRITNTLRLHHYEAIDGVYTHLKVKEISTQDTFRTAATTIGYSDY